ncbi:MAG: DNRLRE domain-containing protein [Bacteroidetes bacterium]|nr:DNRLRE domain-containing protein [Bacteroidota bacterium]
MRKILGSIGVLLSVLSVAQPTNVTINIVSSGTDSYVSSGATTSNFDNSGRLYANFTNTGAVIDRTFIKADLSSIPSTAIILSATLNMYAYTVNNGASHPFYLRRVAASWSEAGITWANQPTVISSDQISIPHNAATGWHSFNVLSHVQYMVNYPSLNFGWRLSLQNEAPGANSGAYYRDSEQTGFTSQRPTLTISYVNPIQISGVVKHCTEGMDDGTIAPSVTGGSGTYNSYTWYRYNMGTVTTIETGTNIANADVSALADGLYMLVVGDNSTPTVLGYQYFLIGEENTITTVEFSNTNNTNSALFNDDAQVQYTVATSDGTLTGGSSTYIQTQVSSTSYLYSLLKYNVNFDPLLSYESANLYLYSVTNGHTRDAGNTNASQVSRIVGPWIENTVTWNTKPNITATDQVTIPQTTPTGATTRDDVVDLIKFVRYWSTNPTQNYGVRFDINTAQSGTARLQYQSYDFTTHAKRPKLVLVYSLDAMYYELSESPQGSYYSLSADDILRVKYTEEYLDENLSLSYVIKDQTGATVLSNTTQPKTIEYGDNRERINVSSLAAGYYTFEVTNDKNEKWYLRFQVV